MLDVYELCAPEIQEKMAPLRSKFKDMEDRKLEKQQQKVRPIHTPPPPGGLSATASARLTTPRLSAPQVNKKFEEPKEVKYEAFSFPDGV